MQGLSRRLFLALLGRAFPAGLAALGLMGFPLVQSWAAAARRKLLPAETPREELAGMAPTLIDARRIAPTPLEAFKTMGTTDYEVGLELWRLRVVGAVSNPTSWTYDQLLAQPVVERKVLMICPGVFANQGVWRGLAIWPLLEGAGIHSEAGYLVAQGQEGGQYSSRRFPLQDVRDGKIFLSYAVNGRPLPVKHGYPLRIVAADETGDQWVKYVTALDVLK